MNIKTTFFLYISYQNSQSHNGHNGNLSYSKAQYRKTKNLKQKLKNNISATDLNNILNENILTVHFEIIIIACIDCT